jgi:RHS repeat-associated protein
LTRPKRAGIPTVEQLPGGPNLEALHTVYDLFGRETKAVDPDRGTTDTTYDLLDRTETITDSEGRKLISGYDDLDRRTGLWQTGKTDADKLAAWTFDTPAKGQQSTATRYDGGVTGKAYTAKVTAYDALYQVTRSQLELPDDEPLVQAGLPNTLSYSTGYRLDGTVSQASQPAAAGLAAETVSYTYNNTGQHLTSKGTTGYLQGAAFSPQGDLRQLTLGMDGTSSAKKAYLNWDYEAGTRRLTRSYVTDDVHGYMPQELKYTQDDAGNVTSIFDGTTQGGTAKPDYQCFTYDGHRRLAEAWTPKTADCAASGRTNANIDGAAPYWTSYTYNEGGQRKTETQHSASGDTTTAYTYNTSGSQPHTLLKTEGGGRTQSYAYDKTGNTTVRPGPKAQQTLDWNAEGKLIKTTEDTAETGYLYDADGELLIRRAKGDGDTVLYLGGTEVRLTTKGTTKTLSGTRYYSANGRQIAVRTAVSGTSGSKLSFVAADHHGTSSLVLDATTYAVTKRYSTPFGGTRGAEAANWPDDKGFLGKPADKATGLTSVGAREYDPAIGQFISVDPILSVDAHQSLNGYAYADNNPITFSDPTGLKKNKGLGALLGVIGAALGGVVGAVISTVGAVIGAIGGGGGGTWGGGGNGLSGTATTVSTGTTKCYYAMGMNQCTTTSGAPPMTDNSTNTGNSGCGTPSASGYPACPGLIGEQGNPEIVKELLLIGCGWIPIIGSGCDGYDLKRSVDEGDKAGSALGILGFIPLIGDAMKLPDQLKDLERVADDSKAAKARPIVKWSTPEFDGWQHVLDNHRTSGPGYSADPMGKGVFQGKFVKGDKLKKRIQEAVGNGMADPNTKGRDGTVYEYNFGPGNAIGRLSQNEGGGVSTAMRVILNPDGSLRSAHPI